jgi:hypothetical protein
MSDQHTALQMIQRQLGELEEILKKTTEDLNTVAGQERVEKWKKQTTPLIARHVGPQEAQKFSGISPGPSFTNDLLEEFSDEIEVYRNALATLSQQLKKTPG